MSGHPLLRPDFPPVLIVSGCGGATQRYRCFHHQEQLRWRGIPTRLIVQGHPELLSAGLGCGVVLLHRVAMDPAVEALIRQTHDGQGVVLFDIDDLVFDPQATHWHRGVKYLPPEEQALYHDGVRRYRQTLLACDGAVVSTAFLARCVEEVGRPVWISRNCLDLELIQLSGQAVAQRQVSAGDRIRIGYASGSRTHDEDFAAAAPALREVMHRHPEVELCLVGPLELGPEWGSLADRVTHLPAVDWRRLPAILATFEINLAPLEIDNPFCQAKSELKWLEASACRVPTVATATEAFATAIDEGRTGFLARDVDQWQEALERLVTDVDLRRAVGQAAFEAVRTRRTTLAQAPHFETTLDAARRRLRPEQFPPPPPPSAGALRVNFLVPEPVRGSGGHMSIMRLAGGLAERGHEVTVHVDPGPLFQHAGQEELVCFFRRHFPPAPVRFRLGRDFRPADVIIATGWTTASAAAFAGNATSRLYFVQDFEPYFQPLGPGYIAAESTYRLGLGHITLGPWLSELLASSYGARAVPIDFGVEHQLYWPGGNRRRRQVVFYGRGTTPRRGTPLGLAALRLLKQARPDVEVVLYGGRRQGLDADGFRHVGVLTPSQLAELYRRSLAGLALSYTNLSFVPLEMMACGCAVVAVDAPAVRWFLRHGQNAVVTESTAESLAAALLRVLDDNDLRQRIVKGGRQAVAGYSWERSAEQFEAHVRDYFTASRAKPGLRPRRSAAVHPRPVPDALVCHGVGELALAAGRQVGWRLPCAVDWLYRVDLRLVTRSPAPRGQLVLHLKEHPAAEDLAVARRRAAEVVEGAWLAFEFPPLAASAGRVFYLVLEWTDAGPEGEVAVVLAGGSPAQRRPSAAGTGQGGAAGAQSVPGVGQQTTPEEQDAAESEPFVAEVPPEPLPVHRTFGLSGPAVASGPAQLQAELIARQRDLAQLRVARAQLARSPGGGLIRIWRQFTRPMPPPELRPWPETAPLAVKLVRGLVTYGPVAVARELWHYLGWRWQGGGSGQIRHQSVAERRPE